MASINNQKVYIVLKEVYFADLFSVANPFENVSGGLRDVYLPIIYYKQF